MKQKILILFAITIAIANYTTAQSCQSFTYTNIISGTITTSLVTDNYFISGDIDVSSNVDFSDAEILIDKQVKITVHNGGTLTIRGSHLFGCTDMWAGIVVEHGGKLIIDAGTIHDNSFIEDADIAIQVYDYAYDYANLSGANALSVNSTVFNRNRIGIEFFESYNANSSSLPIFTDIIPVVIKNAIFTCRDIYFPIGLNDWFTFSSFKNTTITNATAYPNTPSIMSSPYINEGTYPSNSPNAYLKAPFNISHTKSEKGINFNNNYYQRRGCYKIGDGTNGGTTNNVTIFDNQTTGISLLHADALINNCTFQNTIGANLNTETYGIFADNWDEVGYYLKTSAPTGTPHNAFFDCKYAVNINLYNQVYIEDCDIRSSKITPIGSVQEGFEGITIRTNSFGWSNYNNALYLNKNELANIAYPITVKYDDHPWNVHGGYSMNYPMELVNTIEVNNNWINVQPKYLGNNFNTLPQYFVDQAINLEVVVPTNTSTTIFPPLRCNGNLIQNVYNGIRVSNWVGKDVRILNNWIVMYDDVALSTNLNGIVLDGCVAQNQNSTPQQSGENWVYANFVVGKNTQNYNLRSGILINNGSGFTVRCNITGGKLKSHFQFRGGIPNTLFFNNHINPTNPLLGTFNDWGIVLYKAIIGQQGNAGVASDNDFPIPGAWVSGKLKTMCYFSDATQSPLIVQQSNPVYDPTGFNGSMGFVPNSYDFTNGSLQAGSANSYS